MARQRVFLIFLDHKTKGKWPDFPFSDIVRKRCQRDGGDPATSHFTTVLPNDTGTRLTVIFADDTLPPFERFTGLRLSLKSETWPRSVGAWVAENVAEPDRWLAALALVLAVNTYRLPQYKTTATTTVKRTTLTLFQCPRPPDLNVPLAIATGNNLCRRLIAQPPNILTTAAYLKEIRQLARDHQWSVRVWTRQKLQQQGAGAFLAVARGGEDHSAIVRLRYPGRRQRRTTAGTRVALVGKGICFDTGGLNLKPARAMLGMHHDMAGSAVALGVLLALTRLKVSFEVDCWLAITDNAIGPDAYRQNEVLTAANGTTIEVVHTDAEGRLVLADTLALCAREHPDLILDYATLTGACCDALGRGYSGVFTNRPALHERLIAAGRHSAERVWPFPMDDDYNEALASDIADIRQCTLDNDADHILGAKFLQRFVDDIPWIHVDLSAACHKDGLAFADTEITGFGVAFTIDLLLHQRLVQDIAEFQPLPT